MSSRLAKTSTRIDTERGVFESSLHGCTHLWNANRWTLDYPKNLTFYGNKKTEAYLWHLFVCHGLPEVQNVLCLAWADYIV